MSSRNVPSLDPIVPSIASSSAARLAMAAALALILGTAARAAIAAPEATSKFAAFERATSAARAPDSGGGSSVTRAELRNAIAFFLHDDGVIDASERGHLGACLADPSWREDVAGAALAYATELHELYADSAQVPLTMTDIQEPLVDRLGAPGALTSSVWLQEGRVTAGGVISHAALRASYERAFGASVSTFDPINVRELVNELSGRLELGMPTQDEIDGVLAYFAQAPRPATHLYLASWISARRDGSPGDIGGVVIAAVSADRRFVRFLELHSWSE